MREDDSREREERKIGHINERGGGEGQCDVMWGDFEGEGG